MIKAWRFLRVRKRYWLTPALVSCFIFFGLLFLRASGLCDLSLVPDQLMH